MIILSSDFTKSVVFTNVLRTCSVRAPYVLRTCSVCAPYALRTPAEALHHPTQFHTTTFKNGDNKPQASALSRNPFTNRCSVSST